MITLKDYKAKITEFLDATLLEFASEHPTVMPTTIGLYCCPWTGLLSLCLNTGDSDSSHQDNCPDFKYVEYGCLEVQEWRDEYESDAPKINLSAWRTIVHNHEDGDESFNKPFFKFLIGLLEDYFGRGRCPVSTIWVGVQMLDSALIKFWKM